MNHMKLYDELMKLNLIKDNKYIQVFGKKKNQTILYDPRNWNVISSKL